MISPERDVNKVRGVKAKDKAENVKVNFSSRLNAKVNTIFQFQVIFAVL